MSDARTIVAIDGPAGAGKSSVAKRVAKELGYAFLDTGAMYRAATWRAMNAGVPLDDAEALTASTRAMQLEMSETPEGVRVVVDGEDVSEAIRTPEITREIYRLDQIPAVRAHLVSLQRTFGERQPTVAEGRDIGTVVFPKSACKIFLDASPMERARRRAAQMAEKGVRVDVEEVAREIAARDKGSRTRAVAPLRQAEDAVLVDTTKLDFEAVVARIVSLARGSLCR